MADLFSRTENPKSKEIAPITFDFKPLRTAVNEKGETVYCLSDVLAMITETTSPRSLMRDVQKRLLKQGVQLCEIVAHVKFKAKDGKYYSMLGGTREQIFRVLQEVNSPRVAPFKSWLAQLGNERLEEIENPEKGVENATEAYRKQGKSDSWIEADTLQSHGITKAVDFAHFTDRTNIAVYGHKAQAEKASRGITKTQNLRDCSTETELGLLYLHESACREGIEKTDAYGRTQIDGVYDVVGGIIANTKQALESAFKPCAIAGTD